MQDKFKVAILDIIKTHPQTIGLSDNLMNGLTEKLSEKTANWFFSLIIDFQKKQIIEKQFEERKKLELRRIEIINQNQNIDKLSFEKFIIENLNALVQERSPEKEFILDKYCQNTFNLLLGYFHGSGSALNPRRGVCLLGPVGTGKSTLITAFKDNPFSSFRILKAQEIVEAYIEHGDNAIQKILKEKPVKDKENQFGETQFDILIEEIGREQRSVIVKGDSYKTTPVNVIQKVLMELYDQPNTRIHMVSNADDESKLIDLYDEAAASRIYDMFNVITLDPNAPNRRLQ